MLNILSLSLFLSFLLELLRMECLAMQSLNPSPEVCMTVLSTIIINTLRYLYKIMQYVMDLDMAFIKS